MPASVQKAEHLANLPEFLEGACPGFHWDILDRMEDGVYLLDTSLRIMYWSGGAERITGYPAEQVLGRRCSDNLLNHVDSCGKCLCGGSCPMASVIATGTPQCADVFLHHADGHRVPVRIFGAPLFNTDAEIIGAFETFSDTTSLLAPLERARQLEQMAFLDVLTGIANRRLLERELKLKSQGVPAESSQFGVVLLDIDHFKNVNDTHGHATGDRVLLMVAQTLARCSPRVEVAGRWGGEEFLLIGVASSPDQLEATAEAARKLVAVSSLHLESSQLRVTVSAGATLFEAGECVDTLLARADHLLYRSKSEGRNRVTVG